MIRATSRIESFSETHWGFVVITSRTWRVESAIGPPSTHSSLKRGASGVPLEGNAESGSEGRVTRAAGKVDPVIGAFDDQTVAAGEGGVGIHARGESVARVFGAAVVWLLAVHADAHEKAGRSERLGEFVVDHRVDVIE